MPAKTRAISVEAPRAIMRLPNRNPRSNACWPVLRYSGISFCEETASPKSSMLPTSNTQVQT